MGVRRIDLGKLCGGFLQGLVQQLTGMWREWAHVSELIVDALYLFLQHHPGECPLVMLLLFF